MPSAYAHYRFGQQVLALLPAGLQARIRPHQALYDIGLHGPDILFYYEPLHAHPINRLGNEMHDRPGAEFFAPAQKRLARADRPDAALAYVLGFLCHFVLDSRCHPYINRLTADTPLTHAHIEAELDAVLMARDGLDPTRYAPVRHIRPTAENAAVIAPFFPGVSPAQIRRALQGMVLSVRVLTAPTAAHRELLYAAMRLAHQYDALGGLIITPARDPACAEPAARLQALYADALAPAAALLADYAAGLPGGAPLGPCFTCTFG